jgi:hypothetical protein
VVRCGDGGVVVGWVIVFRGCGEGRS